MCMPQTEMCPNFLRNCEIKCLSLLLYTLLWLVILILYLTFILIKRGRSVTHEQSAKILKVAMQNNDIIDIWRTLYPDKEEFTWSVNKPNRICVRLDYILVSESLAQLVTYVKIIPGFRTDHSMVSMQVMFEFAKKGPGYWKLFINLLQDKVYLEKINKLIDIELAQDSDTLAKKWELIKLSVRGTILQYSARKSKSERNTFPALERKLAQLNSSIENQPFSLRENKEHQMAMIKKDIQEIYHKQTQGAIMRSRARWENLGEKPTRYFCNLEKQNYSKKTIYRLQLESGEITSDQSNILQEQENFFKKLYTTVGEIDENYVNGIECPQISKEEYELLKSPISQNEISTALKSMANCKSPGTDGLQADFYKVFYNKLKYFLCEMYSEAPENKVLHLSARRGIISLLEKINKNLLQLKSYRPLSLLNSDYKILSKVFALRLKKVLNNIIHKDQTGFLPGRYMAENVMKMLNLMEYCERQDKSAVIISLDFEKAFDKLEWRSIQLAMEAFSIGPKFREYVEILYKQPVTCTMNNGMWSNWFEPSRSCRQGGPDFLTAVCTNS